MKIIQRKRPAGSRHSGQVLLEAAVAVTFLLAPMVLGLVQFGIFYNATNSLSAVAREAGRETAIWGHTPSGTTNVDYSDTYIIQATRLAAQNAGLIHDTLNADGTIAAKDPNTNMTITFDTPRASRTQYGPVTVTVTYDLTSKSFFPLWKPGVVSRSSYVMCQN